MLHPSTKKLVDRLIEMTELRKLRWQEADQDSILYSTEGYSVIIVGTPQEIVITSREGRELERANSAELAETVDEGGRPYSELVADMYDEAVRIARGTEAAISSLLAGIDVESQTDAEPIERSIPIVAAPEATNETETLTDAVTDETTVLTEEGLISDSASTDIIAEDATDAEDTLAAVNKDESEIPNETQLSGAGALETNAPSSRDPAPIEVISSVDDPAEAIAVDETASLAFEDAPSEEVQNAEENASIVAASEREFSDVEETSDAPDVEPADIAVDPDSALSDAPYEEDVDTPKMTAAVARLAEEVNGRDNAGQSFPQAGTLTAAAGGLATAVAMAEETPASASSETASTDVGVEETDISAEPAALEFEIVQPDIKLSDDTSDAGYIPFGVVPKEADPEPTAVATETIVEITEAPNASEETEIAAAPIVEAAPEPEITPDPVVEAGPESEASADTEPVMVATPEVEPITAPEPVSAAMPVPETTPEPQGYGLSGIGAGFGLTPLATTTEASGAPGSHNPAADKTTIPEKIVIDAVDEVPPPVMDAYEAASSGPSGLSFPQEARDTTPASLETAPPATTAPDGVSDTEDTMLKPRTRFNPWD